MSPNTVKQAEAYVTEMAGGFIKLRLLSASAVSFYLTETQFTKAEFSLAKYWPGQTKESVVDKGHCRIWKRTASPGPNQAIRLGRIVQQLPKKPVAFPVSYYIELEDLNDY